MLQPVPEASILPERSTFNSSLVLPQDPLHPRHIFWCVLGPTKLGVSTHIPYGYDTLEYSLVEATTVSVRLRIYFASLKYPTLIMLVCLQKYDMIP